MLLALFIGIGIAVAFVAFLKAHGLGPQIQRLVAFGVIGAVLLGLTLRWRVGPGDALSTATALTGVSVLAVAGLTYVGSVDKDPSPGCLNTNGGIRVTTSGDTTVVYSQATAASEGKGLLLRGCELRGTSWCVGAVHEDAIEKNVFDSRWLVLSGDQGLVPVGRTVGEALPEAARDDDCPGAVAPPNRVGFTRAAVDRRTGALAVVATAPRAAFIGFAIRRTQDRWQRLGWDYEPSDTVPVVLPPPAGDSPARLGDQVTAVACLGYQQAAMSNGSAVAQDVTVRAGPRMTPARARTSAAQPEKSTAAAAACTSSVPTPTVPYGPGTVAKQP